MGDKDKAIRNLHLSEQFLGRCATFTRWPWHGNDGMELSINLLLEIWKVHFVATKYYLDCGVLEQEVSSPLLELTVNDINVNETILLSAYERREWCKITVTMFQNLSELLNKKMIATADIQREAKGREKILATAAIQAANIHSPWLRESPFRFLTYKYRFLLEGRQWNCHSKIPIELPASSYYLVFTIKFPVAGQWCRS